MSKEDKDKLFSKFPLSADDDDEGYVEGNHIYNERLRNTVVLGRRDYEILVKAYHRLQNGRKVRTYGFGNWRAYITCKSRSNGTLVMDDEDREKNFYPKV